MVVVVQFFSAARDSSFPGFDVEIIAPKVSTNTEMLKNRLTKIFPLSSFPSRCFQVDVASWERLKQFDPTSSRPWGLWSSVRVLMMTPASGVVASNQRCSMRIPDRTRLELFGGLFYPKITSKLSQSARLTCSCPGRLTRIQAFELYHTHVPQSGYYTTGICKTGKTHSKVPQTGLSIHKCIAKG